MNRGITKGLRMVEWSIEFGTRGGHWVSPSWYGIKSFFTKKELKNFLRKFQKSDWPQWDIISVKIKRWKRIGTTRMWEPEVMGYTDVNENGTLYYIEL